MTTTITDERRAMRRVNSGRDTLTVLAVLKQELPDVWQGAEVVGRWVWVTFDSKPDASVREALLDMGFHWNHTRAAWQHACGCWTPHGKCNPRFKYGTALATEFADVAGRSEVTL